MADPISARVVDVRLREWIRGELARSALGRRTGRADQMLRSKRQSLLRRATVAYGMAELLKEAKSAAESTEEAFNVDNFVVHTFASRRAMGHSGQTAPWDDIKGVSMISPELSARLTEPSFLSEIVDDNIQERMGRYLELEITAVTRNTTNVGVGRISQISDSHDCRLFGILLYELYSGLSPFPAKCNNNPWFSNRIPREEQAPTRKLSTVRYDKKKGKAYSTPRARPYTPLREMGCPSSICSLVQSLIDGDSVYPNLDAVGSDIHLLLSDPESFLCDLEEPPAQGGSVQLTIRKGKLYGRGDEVSLITDAFCHVSSGQNTAFFIGGYSGSGKTMLVHSLTPRVDINGGYVLSQKLDQMTAEKPLLGLLSAFDHLCLLIMEKCPPRELLDLAGRLARDFESDFSALARLMPNVRSLFPRPMRTVKEAGTEQVINLHNVCHTLRRFMRIVSSRLRPVMLFLDDLQWATGSTLELIRALLLDTRGSSCFFFVGSYRDNEVKQGHPLLELMSSLESSPIRTTSLTLRGLKQEDLNMMIAETLGVFPRLCKPLSDAIFEKTSGNPLFALEFLRSLVDSRLLKYSQRERQWIFDECRIADENITDNVLYLLTAKMTSLPETTQSVLRVLSCFGIKSGESVVGYIASISRYSDFLHWVNQAIDEGFLQRAGSEFKFVHDKVREAAYGLIPESSKSEFHYHLGISLLSASNGEDLGRFVFQIVDQINHGIPTLIQPTMQMNIAELNFSAGSKAIDSSDFETAQSYLNNALALLPESHWISNYGFSLRLFVAKAKSAYSRGKTEEAYDSLTAIIKKGRCVEDKLDAYYLYATMLHACEESEEAFTTCREVLSQLNETIPDSIDIRKLTGIIKETGGMLRKVSNNDLLEMKGIDGVLSFTLKFYTLLVTISYWRKPEMMAYFGCRMIRLTLEAGVCEDSVFGLLQYAAVLCRKCKLVPEIREANRIANAAMSLLKQRFDSSENEPKMYLIYYGFVAERTQPFQLCSDYLRRGFEVGMSAGDSVTAFLCSLRRRVTALISGANLLDLLKETDHHLEIMARLHLKLPRPGFLAYRETISTLIDKGQSTGSQTSYDSPSADETEPNAQYAQSHNRSIFLNRSLQSFWLGYSQRCHHYAKKLFEMPSIGENIRVIILFYAALNAFRGIKNNNGNGSQFLKAKALYQDARSELQNAAKLSPCNFRNKLCLLEAELYSFNKDSEGAKSLYDAAITSSCSSKFVHEEGLSCELAALHYKRIGDHMSAHSFFSRARECYTSWGSQMKVDAISRQLDMLHNVSNTTKS